MKDVTNELIIIGGRRKALRDLSLSGDGVIWYEVPPRFVLMRSRRARKKHTGDVEMYVLAVESVDAESAVFLCCKVLFGHKNIFCPRINAAIISTGTQESAPVRS